MSMQLGLQLFSARNAFVENRSETLKKIAEIGYKHIEVPVDFSGKDLFGTGELKAADLKEMAEAVGLNILATHVLMTEESQFEKVIAFNQSIQCKNVVIPIAFFKNYEDVISFSETLNRYGKELHANGMKLYYHNHFHEFQRFDGKHALDIILEHTDPEYLSIELDTYWALRAGIDIKAYLKKLGSRCGLIHQKDLPGHVKPVNIFEEFDEQKEITLDTMFQFMKPKNFTEIGQGTMDISNIIRAAEAYTDAQYIIVEQDATTRSELESIAMSYSALSALMSK